MESFYTMYEEVWYRITNHFDLSILGYDVNNMDIKTMNEIDFLIKQYGGELLAHRGKDDKLLLKVLKEK